MQKKAVFGLLTLIGVAIVSLIFLSMTSGLIQQWLWMRQVGYLNIFWPSFFIPGLICGLPQKPRLLFSEQPMATLRGFI